MEDGSISDEVIKMRLSEQYVKALSDVFAHSSIVSLPDSVRADLESGSASAETMATAFTLF